MGETIRPSFSTIRLVLLWHVLIQEAEFHNSDAKKHDKWTLCVMYNDLRACCKQVITSNSPCTGSHELCWGTLAAKKFTRSLPT